MRSKGSLFLFAFLCLFAAKGVAFNPPVDNAGPLRVGIRAPDVVRALGEPVGVAVDLVNSGSSPIVVRLEVWVIDDWWLQTRGRHRIEQEITLKPGQTRTTVRHAFGGAETYNAHYPIHARATFIDPASGNDLAAHAIKILVVDVPNPASRRKPSRGPTRIQAGLTSLVDLRERVVSLRTDTGGATRTLGIGWSGSDKETGATFHRATVDRGGRRECFSVHPPWRKGWGTIWADYDLVLPDLKPIALTFSTAIRDHTEKEPPSDGVEFKVFVAQPPTAGKPRATKEVFTRFSASKTWEDASVDLSKYAGSQIGLRLWTGPGPQNNTVCDSGHWGAPSIQAGHAPKPESPKELRDRMLKASGAASRALEDATQPWSWEISSEAGTCGVAVVPGMRGPSDTAMSFFGRARGKGVSFTGFEVEVDGVKLSEVPGAAANPWTSRFLNGRGVIAADLLLGGEVTKVQCEIWEESGALRFRFSMPGVKRDKRGHPRFTKIGLGPAVALVWIVPEGTTYAKAKRVYAGFGNVVENPGRIDLRGDGFQCSTSHAGIDFENSLSLVQATDIFPDRFIADPDRHVYSLQTHHDATISLIPSEKGAFAAAKVYRDGIANFKPSPGHAKLLGKMCLDYWGTDYQHGIDTVETLAKYGVTDCVYVWHNWQRWGYDYRLPEIYPARADHALFVKLRETCRKHGILFCPHDNYIDFYPDAEGYSYKHIIFNEDGTPQKAWFNRGRRAQSYRWLPHAFFPWMKKNVALLKQDVKPDAYFIDVFTAIRPMDYYDIDGRFYPKTRTIEEWSRCFDYVREQFGGAPQISEAGHDTQIGHIAAGEADHMGVVPNKRSGQWGWYIPCADGERTPWHDAASHGSFILFGGGLANRYVGELDRRAHGYGSDDYLSLTVLGGRNPMAHGDASPETIRTYWLLHDICAELGRRPMTSHEFSDDNIHRQIVKFGEDAVVYVNRGKEDWKVAGPVVVKDYHLLGKLDEIVIPPNGFVAVAGDSRADVIRRDGAVTAYSSTPEGVFADARPRLGAMVNDRKVIDFGGVKTNGVFRLLRGQKSQTILLMPGCPPSEIHPTVITSLPASITHIERLDESGRVGGKVETKLDPNTGRPTTVFDTDKGDFGFVVHYRLELDR